MGREIKFRGWIPTEKRFIFFDIFTSWNPSDGGVPRQLIEAVDEYTGLLDKNGVEEYEGDQVKDDNGEIIDVRWNNTEARFMATRDDGYGFWMGLHDVTVIGNIHEVQDETQS